MRRRELVLGAIGIAVKREDMEAAAGIVARAVAAGEIASASLVVRRGAARFERSFGRAATPGAVFLLASITKPMTATAAMMLVDRGEIALSDPVRKYIPEFAGGDREHVTVRHLLTHTSGLPDMLPENLALRRRHAPLADFIAATCATPLLFRPGTEVRYQSMGILLAAAIVERVTGTPLRRFLAAEVFGPLGMKSASLGLGGRRISDLQLCQVSGDEDWNWNSAYWRDLGVPWGGAHASAPDVATFLELFLQPSGRILKPETAASMIRNQTEGLNEARGLGWMVQPGTFGKGCSSRTFGHYGSTGTMAWADPQTGLRCVLLTTKPASGPRDHVLGPVADLVSRES